MELTSGRAGDVETILFYKFMVASHSTSKHARSINHVSHALKSLLVLLCLPIVFFNHLTLNSYKLASIAIEAPKLSKNIAEHTVHRTCFFGAWFNSEFI